MSPPDAVHVSIAGVVLALRGEVPPALLPFACDGAEPDVALDVSMVEPGTTDGPATPRRAWREEDTLHYEGPSGRGRLDLAARAGTIRAVRGSRPILVTLRLFLGALLPTRGGLLLHGAAVVRDGRGYLFAGPSGAGKSTIAALAAASGATILNDEVVALCPDPAVPGRARLHGTPLGSAGAPVGGPGDAPLALLAGLRHTPAPLWTPLGRASAVRFLLAQTVVAPEVIEPGLLLDTALALGAAAPMGVLGFRKAPDFWDVLP